MTIFLAVMENLLVLKAYQQAETDTYIFRYYLEHRSTPETNLTRGLF